MTTPAQATHPGENGRIAFSSSRGSLTQYGSWSDVEIFTVKPNGNDVDRLTSNSENAGQPDWSPDGRKLVYRTSALRTVRRNGKHDRVLLNGWDYLADPAWSPSGRRVAFMGGDDVSDWWGTFHVKADGTRVSRMLSDEAHEPSWSPSGKKIAYTQETVDDRVELYMMNRDGTNEREVEMNEDAAGPEGLGNVRNPDWSPNGRRIVFTNDYVGIGTGRRVDADVYSVRVDGTGLKRVAGGPEYSEYASWSPDGNSIVYVNDHRALMTMDKDGGDVTEILRRGERFITGPDWGPKVDRR